MACTTTATTTYTLLKYSRSYPSANVASTSTDWQHFTNPALRLILDVTKTEKSQVHSVRLRVIWTIQNGSVITVNDNSEIILEDVDLLVFSSLQPRQGTFMNVPLKAVYRDTTVGIRYLHPLDATNTTSFRRFQISFSSDSETNAFINSIRSVCPCKMSLGAPPSNQQQQNQIPAVVNPGPNVGVSRASEISSTPFFSVQESQYPLGTSSLPGNQTSIVPARRYPQPHLDGNISIAHPPSVMGIPQLSSMPPPPVPSQLTLYKTSSSLDLDVTGDTVGSQSTFSQQQLTQPSSSQTYTAPSSSQVSVRQDTTIELDKLTGTNPVEQIATHPVISALKEDTWIYNLPLDVLERAVGDIIREDGFIPLVEKLDELWKIKSIVGIP